MLLILNLTLSDLDPLSVVRFLCYPPGSFEFGVHVSWLSLDCAV